MNFYKKIVAPVALLTSSLGVVGCGQIKYQDSKPRNPKPTTGLTAEEFAEQNNGRVAWFPGHGRERSIGEVMGFCGDIGAQVVAISGNRVVCSEAGVENGFVLDTSATVQAFDERAGLFCTEYMDGAVVWVEKDDDGGEPPVLACFVPKSGTESK